MSSDERVTSEGFAEARGTARAASSVPELMQAIGHAARAKTAFQNAIEHQKTAARGRMLAGAESIGRIDLQRE